jgi:hypothetical protein
MWKTIVLCASLFASAALGLATAASWLEPSVLPAAAAIGVCLIGVVLILLSPQRVEAPTVTGVQPMALMPHPAPALEPIEDAPPVAALQPAATTGSHPTLH